MTKLGKGDVVRYNPAHYHSIKVRKGVNLMTRTGIVHRVWVAVWGAELALVMWGRRRTLDCMAVELLEKAE